MKHPPRPGLGGMTSFDWGASMAQLAWGAVRDIGQRFRGRAPQDMDIRPLGVADLAAVAEFAATPVIHMHERLACQQAGTETWLVAWLQQRPVGMISVCWSGPRHAPARARFPDCPEVHSVAVESSRRSAGIGSRLLAVCEGLAIARGLGQIGLAVPIDNVHAYALYLRCGYAEPERIEFDQAPGPPDAGGSTTAGPAGTATRCRFLVKTL